MTPDAPGGRVLVSAHRAGWGGDPARENTRAALDAVAGGDADYVEVDVRRLGDGSLVLRHDPWVAVDGVHLPLEALGAEELGSADPDALSLAEALTLLAGRARVHLDLKMRAAGADHGTAPHVLATSLAVQALGAENVLVTTGSVAAVRAVRAWSRAAGRDVRTALSVGGSVAGRPLGQQLRMRRDQLFPAARLERSGAGAVAVQHWLARLGVARHARRAGLPLVVWTVDTPRGLRYWLRPGRAWLVTTNQPDLALAIRAATESRA
ncbi:glycerophosphodiester phosphodiesterase [Nocardioides sp. MAHUQ-72]|uniref:glycerophosphodiester phosphodiesterase n=1 Tax=unclassified Nocardioides TaxID=2615069 RepID=UPI0036139A9C